jgi:hypothetical protein
MLYHDNHHNNTISMHITLISTLSTYTNHNMGFHGGAVHYATSRKVAGSIPDGVTGIFHWHNLSGRTNGPGIDSASNRNEYQE